MAEDSRYWAALAAAIRIVDLVGHPPGDANARLVGKITFLLLESVYETQRRLGCWDAGPSAN